jgi:PAS domain S-box-containing protein
MLHNITDTKKFEESLFQSAGFIRSLVESSTDCIKVLDLEGRLQFMSLGGQKILGIKDINPYLSMGYKDFWKGSDHEAAIEAIRKAQHGHFGRFQGYCPTLDGIPKWWDVSISPITDPAGNVKSLLAISRDVTERKLAEDKLKKAHDELEQRVQERTAELAKANEQLLEEIEERKTTEMAIRRTEEKYRVLVQNLPSIVYRGYKDWSVEFLDRKVQNLLGYDIDEFNKKRIKWNDVVFPEDLEAARKEFVLALRAENSYVREYRVRARSGEVFWLQDRGQIVLDDSGEIEYVSGVLFDITDRKHTEEALRESERKLRLLSSQLLTAQEDERGRIARELHDGIGQSLGAVKVKAETIVKEATSNHARLNVKLLESVIRTVQKSMEEIRVIAMDLWPPTLDSLGILATIGWFCREFQTTYPHIHIEKQIDIQEDEVPEPHKIVIYRILQESFNNIGKHSTADLVRINLAKANDAMTLSIQDNGQGFDPEHVLSGETPGMGFGLASMRERTESLGGSFSIESSLKQGTVMRASWRI